MNLRQLRSLLRSEQGTVAVISAIVMTVMIGFAAIAVDVGAIHYDSRRLQGATDLAAMAAASNTAKATEAARSTFTDNGGWTLNAMSVETGNYDPDPSKALDQRFVANGCRSMPQASCNVADSPIYFARMFRGQDDDAKIAARPSPHGRRRPPSPSDRGSCRSKAVSSMPYWARCWAATINFAGHGLSLTCRCRLSIS